MTAKVTMPRSTLRDLEIEMNQYKFQSMLDKVQALLARAEHPNTPDAEADLCRTKAEAIMFKYKIDQAMLKDSERDESYNKPAKRTIWISPFTNGWYRQQYSLAVSCFMHAECEFVYAWRRNDEDGGTLWLALDVYGYPGDIQYGEMLFIACRLTFLARLEPGVREDLNVDENIYALRHAGVERIRIAQMVGWITRSQIANKKYEPESQKAVDKACARVTSAIKRSCKAKGEDPKPLLGQGNNMKTYRESFAHGYNETIRMRLNRLRFERGLDSDGAIVLVKRHQDVLAMMYKDHPSTDPDNVQECAKCKASKSGHCRQHPAQKYKTTKVNERAYGRGVSAGARVDLTGGNVPTKRAAASPDRREIH